MEQDDVRTRGDTKLKTSEKAMLSAKERDELLGDDFEELGPGFKYKF